MVRFPQTAYYIPLDCFDHDRPADQALHIPFGKTEENYLCQIMARFAEHPRRTQGSYPEKCYDIQLWCHVKDPLGVNNQHFYFSIQDRTQDGAYDILKLPKIMTTVDYAYLVLRLGTEGTFRDDWKKLVHGIDPITGKAQGGMIVS